MTYNHSTLILTVAAMSAGLAPVAAHVGDRLYPISYLSEETLAALDQDDASVEDWIDAVGEPTLTPLDFDLGSYGPGITSYDQYDPSNLDFRIWLGWSRDGKIHFGSQFADDVYYNEYGSGPANTLSRNDHVSLMVDGDHTGGCIGSQLHMERKWKVPWKRTCRPSFTKLFPVPLTDLWLTCLGLRLR